ncbi:polyprenyl synthetase [Planctomycetales bacterium]|nr:polyprenyl synthetase [Planctomycetales bacterium]GHT36431.1 polyprenyl synthetase [Planctomycetales bacterium]
MSDPNIFVLDGIVQKVPQSKEERTAIIAQCRNKINSLPENDTANGIPQRYQLERSQLEKTALSIVPVPEYLGWTMVQLGNILWINKVAAVPYRRRLLLLPHCLRNADVCPAKYSAEQLLCEHCGQCPIGNLKQTAEELGYSVLVAEGSPAVLQWILQRKSDTVLGVGCLRSLERAFSKLIFAGIPATAVPLHTSACRNSETDLDAVIEMIRTPYQPPNNGIPLHPSIKSNLSLLRTAADLFTSGLGTGGVNPLKINNPKTAVREIADSFLRSGGKFYRPFIVLSVFDALTGSQCTGEDGEVYAAQLPSFVKDAARAVEMFHKASLVHDDIEDGDNFRYGRPALHTEYGIPAAVNIGDYLIGEGYRCITGIRPAVSQDIVLSDIILEILDVLVNAHRKLCEGQGAELAWRKKIAEDNIEPSASELIEIYVLKTAPAFEAALNVGILSAVAAGRMNGNVDNKVDLDFYKNTKPAVARYSRHLGTAFQIRNDLDDYLPDNFRQRQRDFQSLRNSPSILRAFFTGSIVKSKNMEEEADNFEKYRLQLENAGVFSQAEELIGKLKTKAEDAARSVENETLQEQLIEFIEAFDC